MALAVPRLDTVSTMRLGQHLVRQEDGYRVAWSAQEMKEGRPHEAQLGPELSELIQRYLDEFRPVLAAKPKTPSPEAKASVWFNKRGGPLSARGIYDLIVDRTGTAFEYADVSARLPAQRCNNARAGTSAGPDQAGHSAASASRQLKSRVLCAGRSRGGRPPFWGCDCRPPFPTAAAGYPARKAACPSTAQRWNLARIPDQSMGWLQTATTAAAGPLRLPC